MKTTIKYVILTFASLFLVSILITQVTGISKNKLAAEKIALDKLENNSDDFVCILSSKKKIYAIGEKLQLQVDIINKTDSTVLFVGSLDGSSIGWRLPSCDFSVKHRFLGDISRTPYFCLTVNDTREKDFVKVEPNGKFDPYENKNGDGFFSSYKIGAIQFWLPGIYTLKFNYRTLKDKEPYGDSEVFDSLWGGCS